MMISCHRFLNHHKLAITATYSCFLCAVNVNLMWDGTRFLRSRVSQEPFSFQAQRKDFQQTKIFPSETHFTDIFHKFSSKKFRRIQEARKIGTPICFFLSSPAFRVSDGIHKVSKILAPILGEYTKCLFRSPTHFPFALPLLTDFRPQIDMENIFTNLFYPNSLSYARKFFFFFQPFPHELKITQF